ncbi:MAG: SDR family oxidoreductase [Gemmatimonadota bacterium]|nr:SDR family oxidoreductase [Gemmatimonadota bacterium]MDH3366606.1 SDR family oxidoreductase [Gemmatimonadota bacterium]MDH3476868.1 SDR family oxidoreductase [Gemmatimonadota bacterium]MDH3569486.1 SDR family oxidoreductase [Gemmatimonadota bacterium]MDH5548492.1 SDR family oxidoreductase [Gemmatimonadota bacterium]
MRHAQRTVPRWALILGASSGFGEATAKELAKSGYDIAGVHLDRAARLDYVEAIKEEIEATGHRAWYFNINANDDEKRVEVMDALDEDIKDTGGTVAVLMHSLAFGTLKPYIAEDAITKRHMHMTMDVMAHSLIWWTQDLVRRGLMHEGGRIFAMTSSGSNRVIPSYGAVSAAKAGLESHVRQLAMELAPLGITANALRGGVTRTPAAERIPESDKLFLAAVQRNPHKRLTVTEDLAKAVVALSKPGTDWITGNVINVDGGEEISG